MTSRAARLAAWPRDKHGNLITTPRFSGGSPPPQGPNDPIGLGAEIYLGPAVGWTDITPYVLYRNSAQFVNIRRGRPNETSSTVSPPQTCSFQLNNRDNRFSPRNPVGPYYQLIGRNTPIRFWRMQNGIRRYRYAGEVVSWPSTADLSGNDVWADMNAAGMLRRLNQGAPPVLSPLYRAYMKDTALPNVIAYWPCEDGTGAQQIGSAFSSGSVMKVVGAPTFASDSSFVCSKALPVLKNSVWTAPVPTGVTWTDNVLRFLFHLPSGGEPNGAVIARYYTSGTVYRVELVYNTTSSGELTMNGYSVNGTSLFSIGPITNFGAGFNGLTVHASMSLRTSGGNIIPELEWVIINTNATTTVNNSSGLIFGSTIGAMTSAVIDPTGNLAGTAVGHVSVQNVWDSINALTNPLIAWQLDTAPGRLERLCTEEGVNQVSQYGDDPNEASLMGVQSVETFLNLVQQCADVDLGMLFEARDQLALQYRERFTLYNQGTAYSLSPFQLTLDFAQNQLGAQPQPQDDDAYTRNDVTVAQINGASARQVLNDGSALSISPPPVGVGPYATTYTLSLGPDGNSTNQMSIADHAGWRLHLGTVDEPRYPQVSINLRHPQFTGNLTLMNAALSVDVGDVIEIDNPPAWLPPDPIRLIIIGYQERMGVFEHEITFNCVPESPYRVMVLDDLVLGRADIDGSTLATSLGAPVNANTLSDGPSLSPWTTTSCTLVSVGTSGSSNPLPAGGPVGYGALLTPAGGVGSTFALSEFIPVQSGTNYQGCVLAYSPGGYGSVFLNLDWYNASFGSISNTTHTVSVPAATWTAIVNTGATPPAGAAYLQVHLGESGTPAASNILYLARMFVWPGTMTVATTNASSPLWTTTAGDFPFDVAIAGERLTVTGVTGSSSPQTFTVARGVNGVSKAQSVGADVRLWQPGILSL